MLDRNKVMEYFDATKITVPIHIIGCGAIGSHIAEQLARMGCDNIHLWDFDTVSPHNVTNQMFIQSDITQPKVIAVAQMMMEINPDIDYTWHKAGWHGDTLTGYVF